MLLMINNSKNFIHFMVIEDIILIFEFITSIIQLIS